MKVKLTEDRIFPTLSLEAKAGDVVEVPDDVEVSSFAVVVTEKAKPVAVKEGDSDGITSL